VQTSTVGPNILNFNMLFKKFNVQKIQKNLSNHLTMQQSPSHIGQS